MSGPRARGEVPVVCGETLLDCFIVAYHKNRVDPKTEPEDWAVFVGQIRKGSENGLLGVHLVEVTYEW